MKSHQLGKVLHWQTALVIPKHLPKGKERVPPPQTSGRQVRRPDGEEGGTSMSSEHCSALQPSACCSFATCYFRQKHCMSRTLARYIFKVRGSRDRFCPGSFTASELAHHSTERFLLEDLSWGPASGCCGQCEYLE